MRVLLLSVLVLAACDRGPRLETRTFALQHLRPGEAQSMIDPYVYDQREGNPGRMTSTGSTLSIRETRENLDRIAEVLTEFDKPRPWVRLHFQLIEADGARAPDPRIADIEIELRKLFRFTGYRLIAEAVASGTAESEVSQAVGEGDPFFIDVAIHDVRTVGDTGIVSMEVKLRTLIMGMSLGTRINAREGQTVVLGNAQMMEGTKRSTVILTVRPELVRG